jgi:hypothetical protein
MKKIKIIGLLGEKLQYDEMAMVGDKNDKILINIDIYVYGREKESPHAVILDRANHRKSLGRFLLTSKTPPKTAEDVIALKEPVSLEHKERIVLWASEKIASSPFKNNWEEARFLWNRQNPNNPIHNM